MVVARSSPCDAPEFDIEMLTVCIAQWLLVCLTSCLLCVFFPWGWGLAAVGLGPFLTFHLPTRPCPIPPVPPQMEKMEKCLEAAARSFQTVRSGRATPALLDRIAVRG